MARYALSDASIKAISLVKGGANGKRFFLRKSGAVTETPVTGDTPLIELATHSRIVKADDWSVVYCTSPDARVLTRDLRWVRTGDLRVGDPLWAFDEYPVASGQRNKRRWRKGEVSSVAAVELPSVRIRFSDGTEIVAARDHGWLARYDGHSYQWTHSSDLAVGQRVCKPVDVWDEDRSYDAGWLAGIFDGEGCVRNPDGERSNLTLAFAQKPGAVLERASALLGAAGFDAAVYGREDGAWTVSVRGGAHEVLKCLGTYRPVRLLDKLDIEGAQLNSPRQVTVEAVEDVGVQSLVALGTTTSTYVCEGFASHNCVVAEPGWVEDQGVGDRTGADDTDEWASADEILKAAHQFMRNGALINHMHHDLAPFGTVVENAVAQTDFTVGSELIKSGSWYIAIEPSPEGKVLIENDELGGVSVQGDALRTLIAKATAGNDLTRKCPTCNKAAPAGATACPDGHKLGPIKKATMTAANLPDALTNPQRGYGKKRRKQADEPDALIKAATEVHEKTIGSKGGDLWGIKGAQLPAYIQHLYNDLVQSGHPTGSETYRLAVGEVENWAEGHDGQGNKVSTDTQTKAAAAIAEWNKLRAQAKADNVKKGSPMHKLIAALAKKAGIDPDAPEFSDVEKSAMTFAQILGASELSDELPCAMDALREAIYNAFYPYSTDGEAPDAAAVRASLTTSLDEFAEHMLGLYDGIGDGTIKKSAGEIAAQVTTLRPNTESEEGVEMEKTEMAELMKSTFAEAIKPVADKVDALEANIAKLEAEKPPTAEALTETVATLEKSLTKAKADIAKLAEGDSTISGDDDEAAIAATTEAAIAHVQKTDPRFAGVLLA